MTGCSLLFGPSEAPRDQTGAITASAAAADAFDIRAGDCLNEPASDEFATVEAVPCSEPHQLEAFHLFTVEQASFPKDEASWDGIIFPVCDPAYAGYIGRAYQDSELEYHYFTPTKDSWSQGDREVVCIVYGAEDRTTGSFKGSNR